ncbi:MAG: hypothetical protein ABEH65_11415 [Halobacteriales archaeon]
MVDPISETERAASNRMLKIGFVILVGISAAMMALFGGATIVETALVLTIGSAIGAALLVLLLP